MLVPASYTSLGGAEYVADKVRVCAEARLLLTEHGGGLVVLKLLACCSIRSPMVRLGDSNDLEPARERSTADNAVLREKGFPTRMDYIPTIAETPTA